MKQEITKTFKGYSFLDYIIEDLSTLFYNIDKLFHLKEFSEISEEQFTLLKYYFVPENLWNDEDASKKILIKKFAEIQHIFNSKVIETPFSQIYVSYMIIFQKYKPLDILYKNILQTCKYIKQEEKLFPHRRNQRNEFGYIKEILRTSLSIQEQILLFYHSLCFKNYKSFVLEFNLLKDLNNEDLISPEHADLFPEVKLKSKYDDL